MNKIAIGIEYDGSNYYGWQRQEDLITLQPCVENALSRVANHPVAVVCAGRTDAGVHATAQVAHFESDAPRDVNNWLRGTNAYLPNNIALSWVKPVDSSFHARFSAISRHYCYVIYNHPVRSAIWQQKTTGWYKPLDEERMQRAADKLLGEHDFTSFRGIACQAKTAIRTLHKIRVVRQQDFIFIHIKANAFLQHMVRNISGVLLAIGEGKKEPQWAADVLHARDRTQAGITAPADGLYLTGVEYPPVFDIPSLVMPAQAGIQENLKYPLPLQ